MKNIVILISGSGSNMLAIAKTAHRQHWEHRFNARISAVISNRPNAQGLVRAQEMGLHTVVLDHQSFSAQENPRAAFDSALVQQIDVYQPHLVVLAGFMRILTPEFVRHYEGRLINIHPSLLPAFAGLHTHQRAIDAGCKFAGATVHRVTAELDHGSILDQVIVPIVPQDTAQTLGARVLAQEHIMYPRVIESLLS
jgi:phosphoribosylglycinamide formyltransferase 1